MDPEQFKLVDEILQSALAVPPGERDAFLRQACAGKENLEREVRSLLAFSDRPDGILETPAIDFAAREVAKTEAASSGPSIIGQTVSHYRIIRELGRGGMGVVYEAEDLKLGRRVAAKFLPAAVTDRLAFERLQREARAASILDHPNICPIYELDEHEGQPFIVMQLLEGQNLRAWIDSAASQDPKSRLDKLLEFSIQIARGLASAHERGIIHRDIKPANVFITSRGDVKILDFSLAKMLEGSATGEEPVGTAHESSVAAVPDGSVLPGLNLTQTGTTMGTASYMSPEQARGEKLDARTDLFSLGLVIYEMAAGQKAFPRETGAAMHWAPKPVHALNPAVPSGLERIIRKSIEPERSRRYGSAREVANDLVALRHQSQSGMLWKRLAGVAAVVLLVATVGIAVLMQKSRSSAIAPSTHAKPRRSLAVLGFRNLSKRAEEEWIGTALAEMVGTELAAGQQLRVIPGENVAHMKLDLGLDSETTYGPATLEKIHKNLGSELVLQGSYLETAGGALRIDWNLEDSGGESIAAISETGSDAQIADLVSRAGASLRDQLGIAGVSTTELDRVRTALPSNPQSARLYAEALARSRTYDTLGAAALLRKAIAADPNHALSHSLLAESLSWLGEDPEAKIEAKKAFELSHALPRENQLLIEGRYHELWNEYAAAIETYRSLWKFFPDDLDYGLRLEAAQSKGSQPKEALLTITELRKLPEPVRSDPRIDIAESVVSSSQGDFKRSELVSASAADKARQQGSRLLEAEAKFRDSWALDRLGELDKAYAVASESHAIASQEGNLRLAASAANCMGTALYDKGDLEGAKKAYQEGLEFARRIGSQSMMGVLTGNIGNAYYDQGKASDAKRYYEQGLEIDRRIDHKSAVASDLGNLANVQQQLGDLAGSLKSQKEALQAFRDAGERRGEATTLANIGSVFSDQGELVASKEYYEKAVKLLDEIGFPRGQTSVLVGLSWISESGDDLARARTQAQDGLALALKLKDDSDTASAQWQLAHLALAEGKLSEAEGLARIAAEEFAREKSVGNECSSRALLARILLAEGKLKDAQAAADAALNLSAKGQTTWATIQAQIASAAVTFKSGSPQKAIKALNDVRAEAMRDGYGGYELDARLLLGQIEMSSGATVSGRARLESLEKDAQRAGYKLIARKARTVLRGGRPEF